MVLARCDSDERLRQPSVSIRGDIVCTNDILNVIAEHPSVRAVNLVCASGGDPAFLDDALRRCKADDLAQRALSISVRGDDKSAAAALRIVAQHSSITGVDLSGVKIGPSSAKALRDLLLPGNGAVSSVTSLALSAVDSGVNGVMKPLTAALKACASVRSLTLRLGQTPLRAYVNLVTSGCQNIHLAELAMDINGIDRRFDITMLAASVLASQVRHLSVTSDSGLALYCFASIGIFYSESCSLASLKLMSPKGAPLPEQPNTFWNHLVQFALRSELVAVVVDVPWDEAQLKDAVAWVEAEASSNGNLVLFDHASGRSWPEQLAGPLTSLITRNRAQFVYNRGFAEGAGRNAFELNEEIGFKIARDLTSGEDSDVRDLVRLALVNKRSYTGAVTGRSADFRNQLIARLNERRPGAIAALLLKMKELGVGLTPAHMQEVRRHARDLQCEHLLPSPAEQPEQWLPV